MKKYLIETISFNSSPEKGYKTVWRAEDRKVHQIEVWYQTDGKPYQFRIFYSPMRFFQKEEVEKAIIPLWKEWLYRLMPWKYKEIMKGVFVS